MKAKGIPLVTKLLLALILLAPLVAIAGDKPELDVVLIAAADSGDLAAVKRLLAQGADVSQRGAKGRTALMQATLHGEMESVKFLLANGADVNAVDKVGYTALNMYCDGPIRDLLKAHGAKEYKPMIVGRPPLF